VDGDGFFTIDDRKKELIITASGKNIAPTKLENLLRARPRISNAMVHCDRRPYVVALLTVDRSVLAATHPALKDAGPEDPELRALFQHEVDAANLHLPRYEQVKKFRIVPEDWMPETGEVTLTLKLKRRVVRERYGRLLDGMYEEKGQGTEKK